MLGVCFTSLFSPAGGNVVQDSESDPFEVSDAETMHKYLLSKKE